VDGRVTQRPANRLQAIDESIYKQLVLFRIHLPKIHRLVGPRLVGEAMKSLRQLQAQHDVVHQVCDHVVHLGSLDDER
jgi:hypothetical protein